ESFRGLFDDLDENLKQHLQTFESEVDSSDTAVIESGYLQDVREDINEVYEELENEDESIHETIEDVSDITSATSPDFSDVNEWEKKSVEKIKELDEDLASFTSTGDETDVKEIMNKIETVMNNSNTSEGKARFADFKGASDNSELKKLMEYNENRTESTPEELNKDNIDELSISEIEKMKNEELDKIEDEAGDILNSAFNDLKEGEIDRETYLNVLNRRKSLDKDAKEGNGEVEFSPELLDYIIKDDLDISDDPIDNIGENVIDGLSFTGLFKAYDLYNRGFGMERFKTKGKKMVRYRVYNPEVAGIRKRKNQSTKIYDKHHMDIELKKGKAGQNIPIADKVNWKEGAKSGLKTKAGWLGVALDTGLNVKSNIEDGESTQKIVGDAAVDTTVGAGLLVAAGAASAFAVGTLGAPVLAGAAIGFGATMVLGSVLEAKWGTSKSLKDHGKDFVQGTTNAVKSGAKTVAGWFT